MSTHLSASQRAIIALQQRIAELELMQREYNAFLNYVICYHGETSNGEGIGYMVFKIETKDLKQLSLWPIKSEIVDNGTRMILRRVEPTNNSPIITLPA